MLVLNISLSCLSKYHTRFARRVQYVLGSIPGHDTKKFLCGFYRALSVSWGKWEVFCWFIVSSKSCGITRIVIMFSGRLFVLFRYPLKEWNNYKEKYTTFHVLDTNYYSQHVKQNHETLLSYFSLFPEWDIFRFSYQNIIFTLRYSIVLCFVSDLWVQSPHIWSLCLQ